MDGFSALIAMSGGVDSSVAAYLTAASGGRCAGAIMRLCPGQEPDPNTSSPEEDARAVAARLGIPFFVLDDRQDFEAKVIRKFVDGYEQGLTPSPCIDCNRFLKFGTLLEQAGALGCDYLVTGHYARICRDEATGRFLLYKAVDENKDQSYFLACLSQSQLCRARFPLGELTKEQVRSIAREQGFSNAQKRDSQDICFVPGGDYVAFLENYTGKTYPQGQFINRQGTVLGTHRGAVCYTIGQRKGLGLAMGEPVYVCDKDMAANTVTVGPNEALFSPALLSGDWNWFPFPSLNAPIDATVKVRHSRQEYPATLYPQDGGLVRVVFQSPQRALTPGQAVVAYQGQMVLGGGTILQALSE